MDKSRFCVEIRAQRAVERIISMSADNHVTVGKAGNDESMIKSIVTVSELDNIARFKLSLRHFPAERSGAAVFKQKAVQELNSCPRRSAVIGIQIVPIGITVTVHYARTGKQALGYKVRTVAPYTGKIVKQRISSQRPCAGIRDGALSVIKYVPQNTKPPIDMIFHYMSDRLKAAHGAIR